MDWYLIAVALITAGAVLSLFCGRRAAAARRIGVWSIFAGAAAVIVAAAQGFWDWRYFFQLPILVIGAAGALYSVEYLAGHGGERANIYWFFYDLTVAAMLYVTLAQAPLNFLLAWEIMGLASGALVMFDRESAAARKAAWMYLAACHAGAALLILFFCFDAGVLTLVCALAGFGLKIGFPLLHIWLPEAHPAAPAPVSALMSSAMIPLGFFGLFRFVYSPETALPLGWALLGIGIAGALGGIVFALPQNDLKRLLAYSSVENMGLIAIAAGLWLLGESGGIRSMALAGLCGALLHMLNHALLKGGLFLGAGAVQKSTDTLNMDRLGGLMRRIPGTGTIFTLNAAGLCGLPPFNGFIGELVIYTAALEGIVHGSGALRLGAFAALIAVALTGGIAAAALAKAVGAVFLGEPRSEAAAHGGGIPWTMNAAMGALFLAALLLTALSGYLVRAISGDECAGLDEVAECAALVCGVFTALAAVLFLLQHALAKRGIRRSATWDCGYARPDARMEYTGSAFTQPLTDFFSPLLRMRRKLKSPQGIFPAAAELETTVEDGGVRKFWRPLTEATIRMAERGRVLQSGRLHFYILLILLTTGGMLVYAMMKG